MSYLTKFAQRMRIPTSKGPKKRKIDEATSNSSLSNLRYVITEKPKWKVFRKREVVPIPAYQTSLKPCKGCPCGSTGPCKQKITPRGVTIHYPQKNFREKSVLFMRSTAQFGRNVFASSRGIVKATKKTFSSFSSKKLIPQKSNLPARVCAANPKCKLPEEGHPIVRNLVVVTDTIITAKGGNKVKTIKPKKYPTWRLDKLSYRPYGPKIITPTPYQ